MPLPSVKALPHPQLPCHPLDPPQPTPYPTLPLRRLSRLQGSSCLDRTALAPPRTFAFALCSAWTARPPCHHPLRDGSLPTLPLLHQVLPSVLFADITIQYLNDHFYGMFAYNYRSLRE